MKGRGKKRKQTKKTVLYKERRNEDKKKADVEEK